MFRRARLFLRRTGGTTSWPRSVRFTGSILPGAGPGPVEADRPALRRAGRAREGGAAGAASEQHRQRSICPTCRPRPSARTRCTRRPTSRCRRGSRRAFSSATSGRPLTPTADVRPRRPDTITAGGSSRWSGCRRSAKGTSSRTRRRTQGPIEDRLKLMRATRVQLSPIFGLFSDPKNEVTEPALPQPRPAGAFGGRWMACGNDLWSVIDAEVENRVDRPDGPQADLHRRRPPPLHDRPAVPEGSASTRTAARCRRPPGQLVHVRAGRHAG